jgi:tRNA pseudouridine55 synthase
MKPLLNIHPEGGLLLIYKPAGWTSFQIVKKIKFYLKRNASFFGIKNKNFKVGHAGTLDPLAEGLMIVCYGNFTKKIQSYTMADKTYEGIFVLGESTPCHDLEIPPDQKFPVEHITPELIRKTAASMTGEQMQTPPLFSAIKLSGKRAYEFARVGEKKELSPRKIHIHSFEILEINMPEVHFRVRCSKGTYIRSLARDFGQALQSGAYLKKLVRTAIGDFDVKNALCINDFSDSTNTLIK